MIASASLTPRLGIDIKRIGGFGGIVADDLALRRCGPVAELALDVFLIEM
jgi:hypothetical protein